MDLTAIDQYELYPTEKLGPSLQGTLLYKVGEQTEFEGAYITTTERMIMNVDMNGESYRRVFSYHDIVKAYTDKEGLILEFPDGMGKIGMVDVTKGNPDDFVEFVRGKLS